VPPLKNKLVNELAVCGLSAVKALAEIHPETINRLFMREEYLPLFTGLCKSLAERKRPYKMTGDDELEKICKTPHHQGVVAMIVMPDVPPLSHDDLDEWAAAGKTGLVLHSVGNDHNLGAIIRTAAFFDAKYIVVSEAEKEAALTTSAYRVAEGGMEHIVLRSVMRTDAFLRDASKKLLTVGTALRARRRIADLRPLMDEAAAHNKHGLALVLGNEERGLPKSVEDSCSAVLRIPGSGNIESLNVSCAAALFLHAAFE
jgi:TrmH RNA methyltransferase